MFGFFCSPEHPLSRARGRSILSGDRQLFREYTDGVAASRFFNFASRCHTIIIIVFSECF